MAKSPEDVTAEKLDNIRIMKLFRSRCVGCMGNATQVHELIPRSRSKRATTMKNNRIPLCASCHNRAHFNGYTQDKADFLRNKAIERLIWFDINLEDW